MPSSGPVRWSFALAFALAAVSAAAPLAARQSEQGNSSEEVREVVATLATGRVTILSAKDGVVVAALGTEFEPASFPPLIVPLPSGDVAVVLGADEWMLPPPAGRTLLRLDQQLPQLIAGMGGGAPSLAPAANISHLDQLGLAVLDPLRAAAGNLHDQLDLPENLPLAELLLIRQTEETPLLIEDVSYWIRQKFWQENFYATEVERPRFMQLYPSKDNQSRMVEVSYPPGDTSPGLMAWLSNPTGPFSQAIARDPKLEATEKMLAGGRLGKVKTDDLVPLVNLALATMAPATETKALADYAPQTGFSWVIQPPASKIAPSQRPAGAPSLETPAQRPASAPSLENPPHSP